MEQHVDVLKVEEQYANACEVGEQLDTKSRGPEDPWVLYTLEEYWEDPSVSNLDPRVHLNRPASGQ